MKKLFQEKKFLKELVIVSVLVLLLHSLALSMHLYWTIEWYDILMHFLGGVNMGFLAVFIFFTSGYIKGLVELKNNKTALFFLIILFTMTVGLTWELWEIFVEFTNILKDGPDTILDLIMDFIGAVYVYFYVKNKI